MLKRIFIPLLIIIAFSVWGAQKYLESKIATGLTQLSLTPYTLTFEKVGFNILTQNVRLENAQITNESQQESYTAKTIDASLPFSLFTVNWNNIPADTFITLASTIAANNITVKNGSTSGRLASRTITNFQASGALLTKVLTQGDAITPYELASGIAYTHDTQKDFTISMPLPQGTLTCTIASGSSQDWNGKSGKSMTLQDIQFSMANMSIAKIGSINCETLHMFSQEFFDRLMAYQTNGRQPQLDELPELTQPLFEKLTLSDFNITTPLAPVSFKNLRIDWLSQKPFDIKLSLDDFSLPATLVSTFSGVRFPHLQTLQGSFSADVQINDKHLLNNNTQITVTDLGKLTLHVASDLPTMPTSAGTAALATTRLHALTATLEDKGLVACLIGSMIPTPAALDTLLTEEVKNLEQADPQSRELGNTLVDFVKNPGTISLSLTKKPVSIVGLVQQNPAEVFSLTKTPGTTPLQEQLWKLFPAKAD